MKPAAAAISTASSTRTVPTIAFIFSVLMRGRLEGVDDPGTTGGANQREVHPHSCADRREVDLLIYREIHRHSRPAERLDRAMLDGDLALTWIDGADDTA